MKKFLSGFLIFLMVFGMFSFGPSKASAVATTIFSDSFGDTSTASGVTGWVSAGGDVDDTYINSGDSRPGSPTSRNARVRDGAHITKTIDTAGYENIVLEYYWRGDNDGDEASDNLKVLWKPTSSETFNLLNSHQLDGNESWSTKVSAILPASAHNTSIDIRFWGDSTANTEEGRVDDVAITGDAIVETPTTTVVVTGNTAIGENQPGWMFNRDISTSTPFAFNTNQASIGTGSLNVLPIGATAANKMVAENFINTPVANVNSISYDFRIGSGGVDTQEEQFYMNVYANFGVSDDLKFYDCRYNVVPTVGSVAGFTTVTFDPTQAYPVATRTGGSASPFTCPAVPADMDTLSAGSNIRMFALNVGDTSLSDVGLDGFLDKVIVNTDSLVTTYDFEPVPLPSFVKVTIAKFINGVQATAENTGGASFPMTASWSAENIGTSSGSFSLSSTGFNNPTPYQATTSDMTVGADYSVSENAATVCTPETPYVLAGYTTGNTLEAAMAVEKSLTVPSFENLTGDKFVIVWNRTCVPFPVHISPADESVRTTAEQTLIDWSDVINWALPISYVYQASNSMDTNPDGTFVSPVYTSVSLATSEIPTPGTPEGVYYWHVKAMDAATNESGWTAPWKITIDNTPEPMCSADLSTVVVSDATTQVDEHNALLIEPHPAYVSITDASWIWSDASALDDDDVLSAPIGTKVFTKTFSVTGTPLDSMLQVAVDNTYTVMVNGNTLDTGTSGTDSDNFTAVDSWTVPASMLMSGSNTITFTVENQTKPEGYTGVNPAGLIYKLTVHQNECETPEPPAPTYAKVHIFKYLKTTESTSQVGDESGLPSFPMTASWNADIGEGTGDYVLGNNHGGATLKYSADTSSMLAPVASYSTYERTGVSEEGVANVLAPNAQCVANTYRLVGYKTGGSLESAMLMEVSTTTPSFTNFSTDQYVIVVNEDCDDVIAQEEQEEIIDDEEEGDDEEQETPPAPQGGGNNGLGGLQQTPPPAPQVLGASTENTTEEKTAPQGEVLGETVCSTIYLNDFLFFRRKNNGEQVKLLQTFLNEHLNLSLVVDGVYGKSTRDAVKAFQVKYAEEVLIPWKPFGLKDETGTGNVYKTTKRKINMIKCVDLNLPIPQLP